eukprot:3396799-Amphidinium_carterae.1
MWSASAASAIETGISVRVRCSRGTGPAGGPALGEAVAVERRPPRPPGDPAGGAGTGVGGVPKSPAARAADGGVTGANMRISAIDVEAAPRGAADDEAGEPAVPLGGPGCVASPTRTPA